MVVLGLQVAPDKSAKFAVVKLEDRRLVIQHADTISLATDAAKTLRKLLDLYGAKHVAIALDEYDARIALTDVPPVVPPSQTEQYVRERSKQLGFPQGSDARAVHTADGAWLCAVVRPNVVKEMRALVRAAGGNVSRIEHGATAAIRSYPAGASVVAVHSPAGLAVSLISTHGFTQLRQIQYEEPLGVTEAREAQLARKLEQQITEAQTHGFVATPTVVYMPPALDSAYAPYMRRPPNALVIGGERDWQNYAAAIGAALGVASRDRGGLPHCVLVDFNKAPRFNPLRWLQPIVSNMPSENIRIPAAVALTLAVITVYQIGTTIRNGMIADGINESLQRPDVIACLAAIKADAARYNAKVSLLQTYDQARYSGSDIALRIAGILNGMPPDVRIQTVSDGDNFTFNATAHSQQSAITTFSIVKDPSANYDARPLASIVPFAITANPPSSGPVVNEVTQPAPSLIHCNPAIKDMLAKGKLP